MTDKTPQQNDPNSAMQSGLKVIIGTLLLIVSIGFMSIWGVFA